MREERKTVKICEKKEMKSKERRKELERGGGEPEG